MSIVQLRFFKRYFCHLVTMCLGSVSCYMLPYVAEAAFLPGQVTDPTCLPSDPSCVVDLFQIPSTGVIIGSATTSPSSVTNRLYNLSGVLYWGGSALGLSSGSINIINGISASIQYFAASSSGSDFSISSASSTHTFNLPNAGVSARGLVSTSSQVFSGAKTFAGAFVASSSVVLNSTLQLSSLTGGLLLTDSSGNVSTSSLSLLLSNSLSSSLNTLTSIVSGSTATTSIINSVVGTSSGNSMTTSVNGVSSASSTIISSNSVSATSGVLSTTINGVTATSSLTTSGVNEGSNLYYTNARDNANFASNLAATTSDALAEGSTNKYFTNARARGALSNTATGLTYDNSTGTTSLTSGYTIPLAASTTDWQSFFGVPSSRVAAGAGLSWNGNTLLNTAIPVLASSTADGLVSTTTQTFEGDKTFNGSVTLGGTLGIMGTTTLATTTVSQFTINGLSTLSAAVTLSALGGGLLQTSVGGVVSTTSIGALTTHTISSLANVLTSIVNGVTSTTTAVNSVSNTSSANTLSTAVNGVTGSSVNIINTNALSWLGQTLTSTINGVATTTSLSLASAISDGLVSSSTQVFGGTKTFNGAVVLASTLGVTGTSTLATTSITQLAVSNNTTLSAGVTLTALSGGLLQASATGTVSTTSIGALTTHTISSLANVLTSIVNGVTSTTTTVNSVSNTSSSNTLSTTVNGITGSTVNIINANTLSWSGQTLTSTINGVATTTNISYASGTTDGLVSTTTQTFGGNKTFNGSVGIGSAPSYALDVRSSVNNGVTGFFQATNSTINGIVTVQDATDAAPGTSKLFETFQNSSGSNIGTISGGVLSGVLYNSISDRRLKDNISTTTVGLSTLMRIPVRDFSMKIDPEHRVMQGYIAQELNQIYPFAVSKTDDDGEGVLTATATPWAVDYGRLTPLIVKSVQDEELQISSIFGSTTVESSSYLSQDDLGATALTPITNSVGDYLKYKIISGVSLAREIVAGRVTALEGWFTRVTASEYCSPDSLGQMVCMNGDDMRRLLQSTRSSSNTISSPSVSNVQTTAPSASSSPVDSDASSTQTTTNAITSSAGEGDVSSASSTPMTDARGTIAQ